ncbi:signal peptidase I [Paeniroseomonas aquatica]|uniref:signal peptidase I n=1 Tax=Paeniroseomonas aquatica TaxID=373043 RepID=UPI00360DC19A
MNRVGRVVGLPNETIMLDQSGLYINGSHISPPKELQSIYSNVAEAAFKPYFSAGPITIPDHQVFILQDNLLSGNDLRSLGTVKLTSVLGRLNDLIPPHEVTAAALRSGTSRVPADVLQDLEEQHGPISTWVRSN